MALNSLKHLRRAAAAELAAYRKNGSILHPPASEPRRPKAGAASARHTPAELANMRRWRSVIDSVRMRLRDTCPEKERFMARYFALHAPKSRRQTKRGRHLQLAAELCVSDSTIYLWRREILDLVVAAALAAGLFTLEGEP